MKELTAWDRLARAVRDQSFIIGSILVVIFVLVAVLGPELAPHNPFLRDRVQTIDGELRIAPFPPNGMYPLGTDDQGRDMLSLLLHGARQTLVIAFVAMVARMLLGLLLGAISGWWPGGIFDRIVMAVTEFLAAIPALILAILLVYAVGIQRGQVTFIVALSLVGWGEIAQIVRGHVITIRNKLFVLASQSVGLGSAEILSRHVLPNLLSTLLALAALEMGGVLLLLGELGFLHIFIGGGGIYVSDAVGVGQAVHYFEIPDWGAMLGTSWGYFRSLPWLPLAPALAFFVAILGFNLFGYGLQRFIEKGRFHPSGWSVLRFFAVIAILLLGARGLLASSSLEAQFADMAEQFDVQRAWNDISYLARPELEGRPPGPGGGHTAAGYIAQQFQDSGLTPLTNGTYFQSYSAEVGRITALPVLEVLDANSEPYIRYENEVSFDPFHAFSMTQHVEAQLVVLMGHVGRQDFTDDASHTVLLILDASESPPSAGAFSQWAWGGILRLVSDERLMQSDDPPPLGNIFSVSHMVNIPSFPKLLIGESAAREMLAEAGLDLDELLDRMANGESGALQTDVRVRLEAGVVYEERLATNVVGYFPAADIQTDRDRILVASYYTTQFPRDGVIYPGADEYASGVAVMMEVARLWHDQGLEPKRTVVFAALDEGGGEQYANFPPFPTSVDDNWTVVMLGGLGAGEPGLVVQEEGPGLARVFEDSAGRFGQRAEPFDDWRFFFINYLCTPDEPCWRQEAYSGAAVTRLGDDLSGTPADTLDHLDPGLVAEAGQVVAHYLMVLSNR